jgi:hypothetical protein
LAWEPQRTTGRQDRHAERPPVETRLEMGELLPPEQTEALDHHPALRHVQPGQATLARLASALMPITVRGRVAVPPAHVAADLCSPSESAAAEAGVPIV